MRHDTKRRTVFSLGIWQAVAVMTSPVLGMD
jgi:hypothetical protein